MKKGFMELPALSLKKHTDSIVDAAKNQFGGIVLMIAVIWGFFLASYLLVDLKRWLALYPRQLTGVLGIVTMPLVHQGLSHIVSNTIPLIVMLITLAALRPKQWMYVVGLVTVVSGGLTWVVASSDNHIMGASGLVLGLVTFLIAPGAFLSGWWLWNRFRKQAKPYPFQVRFIPLAVSAVVGFFCLDNIFFNLVPVFAPLGGQHISYAAHWCGAASGLIVAFLFARNGERVEIEA